MEAAFSAKIRELCEVASKENDGERLIELAKEIIELYDRQRAREAATPPKTP